MEWTIVLTLSTLIGLFFTVGKPIFSLCSTLKVMQSQLNQEKEDMTETQMQIKDLVKISATHEMRIHDLEQDVDYLKGKR